MKHCKHGLRLGEKIRFGKDRLLSLREGYSQLFEADSSRGGLDSITIPYITADAEYQRRKKLWTIRGLAIDDFNPKMTGLNRDDPSVLERALEDRTLEDCTGPSFSEKVKLRTLTVTCNGNLVYGGCEPNCPWYAE